MMSAVMVQWSLQKGASISVFSIIIGMVCEDEIKACFWLYR